MTDTRNKTIEKIRKLTKRIDTETFDHLIDKSPEYLTKLLTVCKNLKK